MCDHRLFISCYSIVLINFLYYGDGSENGHTLKISNMYLKAYKKFRMLWVKRYDAYRVRMYTCIADGKESR